MDPRKQNKTAKDAYRRMDEARYASLHEPALPYLHTLASEIREWQKWVQGEIDRLENGSDPWAEEERLAPVPACDVCGGTHQDLYATPSGYIHAECRVSI